MKTWLTLVRREFWEYRSLWITPLAGVVFVILSTTVLAIQMADVEFGPWGMFRRNPTMGAPPGTDPLAVAVFAFSTLIYGLGALAVASYALDCLYSERKDRSILFWKSLPVSDARTVLSKVAVALVVMPVALTLAAIATNLISGAILSISPSPGSPVRTMWDAGRLLHAYGGLAVVTAVNILWLAPVIAYGMLASVLSSRLPHVTAVVPIVVLGVGEKLLLDTNYFLRFIAPRFSPIYKIENVIATPELWVGVVLAAAVFLLVIRLRRWRDDT